MKSTDLDLSPWQQAFADLLLHGEAYLGPLVLTTPRGRGSMLAPILRAVDRAQFGPEVSGTDALPLPCDSCGAGVAEPCRRPCP